ncbi:MAG: hypothetical protein IPH85_11915 [Ignavibacteria bacterium]|nr:hypothetical protein [Ignavibacteria bacterium]
MKVKELIEALGKLPADVPVSIIYDGASRHQVGSVWLAKSGQVCVCGDAEPVYYDEDRPAHAPLDTDVSCWYPEDDPGLTPRKALRIMEMMKVTVIEAQSWKVSSQSRNMGEVAPGIHEIAVKWGLDEVRVLRNLGVKNVPSPIQGTYKWPGRFKPFEHQIATASFLTMHNRAYVFNEAGCVDSETEYLSPTGWVKISEYKVGKVAQYSLNGSISFVDPEEYVKLPCADMLHFKTKYGVDQLLSPEHRMLVHSSANYNKQVVMSAAEVFARHEDAHAGVVRENLRKAGSDTVGFGHTAIPAAFLWAGGTGIALTDAQLRVQIAVMAYAHSPAPLTAA